MAQVTQILTLAIVPDDGDEMVRLLARLDAGADQIDPEDGWTRDDQSDRVVLTRTGLLQFDY